MASAGTVTLELDANSVKMLRELQKAQRRTETTVRTMRNKVTRAFKTIGASILTAGTAMSAFAAFRGFDRIATELDKINKLTLRLGGSAEAFSELSFVAEQSGLAFNTLTMGLQRMQRRVAEAAVGTGEAQGALKELGLSAKQLVGLSIDTQFEIIADALSGVGVEADRTRLAMKLFDSEGVALLQTMENGAEGIQRLRHEAQRLGYSMSKDQVQAATDAKDAFSRLNTATSGLANVLAIKLAPALTQVADGFANMLSGNRAAEIANRMDRIRKRLEFMKAWFDEDSVSVKRLREQYFQLAKELQGLGSVELPPLPITEIVIDEKAIREGQKRINEMYKELQTTVDESTLPDITPFRHKMYRMTATARESFDQMSEYSKQAARNIQDAFADFLFDPFEDGINGMLKSFLDVIRRMMANKLAASLFDSFGIGGLFGLDGTRAMGGPVSAGGSYLVGEKGPEILTMGPKSGYITPNNKMGGVTVNYVIDARGTDEASVMARMVPILERTVEATKNSVRQDMREGRFL